MINNIEQIARDVLMTGDPVTGRDGALYLDGTMTQAKLSEAIVEAIYVGDIFRDGQSVTKKYAVGAKAGDYVRVPLETPFPSSSRTLAIGGRPGTEGNDGIYNTNRPMQPTDSEFGIVLNQVNDQMIIFPEMVKEWMPIRTMAQRIAGYAKTVVEDRSASTLAEILAYNIYRSLNGADNIVTSDITQEDAYSALLNSLSAKMSDGDLATNAHAYGTQGRTIIARPSFIEYAFNRKSGIILTGSDFAQSMLKDINFDTGLSERNYVGNSFKGYAMSFAWQEANSYIWNLTEKYLGLAQGALDNVYGVAVSYEATAASEAIDLGVKIVDANFVRGLLAQPLNAWGHEAFRLSYIIGKPALNNDSLTAMGFTANERRRPVAPKQVFTKQNSDKIVLPIYNTSGEVIGYKEHVNVPKPNGDNVRSSLTNVTITVAGTANAAITDATLTVTNGEFKPAVVNNGDGTYTFTVGQNTAASVVVAATGYTSQTISLTKANTNKTVYAQTVNLVAA